MRAIMSSLFVVIIGSAALWQATDGLQALTAESARRISVAKTRPIVPDVDLETMSGTVTRLVDGNGKMTLVEFIYTRCPTICQTAGTHLARLRDRLKQHNLADRVRILSVSFDPTHDDVLALFAYGEAHGADGKIWTVTRPKPKDLAKLLKIFRVIVIPDDLGGYEHNTALHVVGADGRLAAILELDDVDGAITAVTGPTS